MTLEIKPRAFRKDKLGFINLHIHIMLPHLNGAKST